MSSCFTVDDFRSVCFKLIASGMFVLQLVDCVLFVLQLIVFCLFVLQLVASGPFVIQLIASGLFFLQLMASFMFVLQLVARGRRKNTMLHYSAIWSMYRHVVCNYPFSGKAYIDMSQLVAWLDSDLIHEKILKMAIKD